jgi:3-isopropylmalate/(R)-2-methylmalate dehydratase small subunit
MNAFTSIESRAVVLAVDNIDTDQIIPARYLTTVSRAGLGAHLFHDWRFGRDGQPRADFVLNTPAARGCTILVAGHNFGCGSSREHAPWALAEFGFRAILATSFADIFRQNALKNGIVPVVLTRPLHEALVAELADSPQTLVAVDLRSQMVRLPGGREIAFEIDSFARECLLNGVDEVGFVLRYTAEIARHEERHPSPINTLQP